MKLNTPTPQHTCIYLRPRVFWMQLVNGFQSTRSKPNLHYSFSFRETKLKACTRLNLLKLSVSSVYKPYDSCSGTDLDVELVKALSLIFSGL